MQRFFDIVFSGIALVLLSPLLLPLIFILRVTGEGEIFFPQSRVGRGGKNFKLYKFATMLKDSPNMGTGTVTVKNDPRVLPMGGFLRKTKINELPQLINIFNGDMSVIGPRPQTQRCFDAFPLSSQNEIIKVRPGLSGIGSIIFRNEEDMISCVARLRYRHQLPVYLTNQVAGHSLSPLIGGNVQGLLSLVCDPLRTRSNERLSLAGHLGFFDAHSCSHRWRCNAHRCT